MNMDEFLNELSKKLEVPSKSIKEDIVNEYRTHFLNDLKTGKTESEISRNLGNPIKLAKEINVIYSLEDSSSNKSYKGLSKTILLISKLSILNIFIVFIPFLILLTILGFLAIGGIVLCITPLFLLMKIIFSGLTTIENTDFLIVLLFVIVGVIFLIMFKYLYRRSYRIVIKYLDWNIRHIKRRGI
ncbi:HAAS signaling domain-containing protein [Staphylococcus intermedius]|uniref:HAAS signaling domain-containing protein n=2 Tax=Staphylococcus intermedius TaxID=1285 RepID=UPI000BBCAAE1|nr:DUF1700 domain-containing protein [Staphylococcus intermedius]PCF83925.1 hypothetical protein B4W76_12445 [Staphylococcus intermedius]PCF85404.1 hypothetical protein B4W75_12385 [Staphylococcus intermedius]